MAEGGSDCLSSASSRPLLPAAPLQRCPTWCWCFAAATVCLRAFFSLPLSRSSDLRALSWNTADYGDEYFPSTTGDVDYLSGRRPFPWHISNCGDVDVVGHQKPQSLYRTVVWGVSQMEMLVHRPSKNGTIMMYGNFDIILILLFSGPVLGCTASRVRRVTHSAQFRCVLGAAWCLRSDGTV